MTHRADPDFWFHYRRLPLEVQHLADKSFELLKANPRHPSLRLKKISGDGWSVRVGLHYRALAIEVPEGFLWTWIGHHSEYDRLLGG